MTDPAWVAGVLDCLARVRIRDTDSGSQLAELSISSPRLDLLAVLARSTGVKVVRVRRHYARAGCRAHCPDPHDHVDSDTGRWQLTGARAVVVLRVCRPYLVTLAAEVDEILAATGDAPIKPATLAKIRALGWTVD